MGYRTWIVLALAGAGCKAAHQCQSRYHTIHVDQIDLDGSLKLHADAESRTEYRSFVACYHESLHSVHWHAKTLRFRGRNTDVVELLPGSMATADMLADNPGTWLLHCHVGGHLDAGMFATFTVRAP